MQVLDQCPRAPAFVQNPYALLRGDPVRFWADYDMPAVFGASLIDTALRDRRLGRAPLVPPAAPPAHMAEFMVLEAASLLELEPQAHTRLRTLVLRALTSARIRHLAPDIEAIARDLIDAFPTGPLDLIEHFCKPLPVRISARLLGVPEGAWQSLPQWSNTMVAIYQAHCSRAVEDAANEATRAFTAFLIGQIEEKRHDPGSDLISHLIMAEAHGAGLTRAKTVGTCVLLLIAGHEATVHTLGNAVRAVCQLPDPAAVCAADRVAATVEEVLRFDPPLHIFTRYVYEDLTLGGHKLHAGDRMALVLGGAGHDPTCIETPHRFDQSRENPAYLAFGAGRYFCLGAPLAWLESQIALGVLFDRCPRPQVIHPPRYTDSYHFHGLERLIVSP
jgi:unspecific monooxygenase